MLTMRPLLALLLLVPSLAQAAAVVWGLEVWTCGIAEFRARLGNGADVRLLSISGAVTAAATADDGVLRQSLLAVYPGIPAGGNYGVVSTTPNSNHSLDEHMLNVNTKQVGAGATPPVPVNLTFNPPLVLRQGDLRAVIVTANYGGSSPVCLNTEAQVTVVYE
jgi:hypothetical protein